VPFVAPAPAVGPVTTLPLRQYTPWHHPYDWRARPDGALELCLWRDGPSGPGDRTCDVAVWYPSEGWGLVIVGRVSRSVTRAARLGTALRASWGAVERLPLCRSRHDASAALRASLATHGVCADPYPAATARTLARA
jgi:hypothetical protein